MIFLNVFNLINCTMPV